MASSVSWTFWNHSAFASGLGTWYTDRLAHIAALQHSSELPLNISANLPVVQPNRLLDGDIKETDLIKRFSINNSTIHYVFSHRTYQEYFAAQFFVEGLLSIRTIVPKQTLWCNELIAIGRFVHHYHQFWLFVVQWIKYQDREFAIIRECTI